ncbi:UNVERIFIED_CONTAM: YncE family protein, partial [Prevotella sp. 15_C9]
LVACSNMAFYGDSLYYNATEWNNYTQKNTINYGIINIKTNKVVSKNFITDGSEKDITIPYGIAIHPETGVIFVTDA